MITIPSRAIQPIIFIMASIQDVMVEVHYLLIVAMMMLLCVMNGRIIEMLLLNGILLITMSVAANVWQLTRIY